MSGRGKTTPLTTCLVVTGVLLAIGLIIAIPALIVGGQEPPSPAPVVQELSAGQSSDSDEGTDLHMLQNKLYCNTCIPWCDISEFAHQLNLEQSGCGGCAHICLEQRENPAVAAIAA